MGMSFVRRNYNSNNPYDFYPTPYETTLAFLHAEFDGEPLPKWNEPACGDGHICRAIEYYMKYSPTIFDCLAFDIREDIKCPIGVKNTDFFELDRLDAERVIITNPPYNRAKEFVEHAKTMPTKKICMLLKLSFLETLKRQALFEDKNFPLTKVYINSSRVSCNLNKTGSIIFAWFVWERRPKYCQPHIYFLNPQLYTEEAEIMRKDDLNYSLLTALQ